MGAHEKNSAARSPQSLLAFLTALLVRLLRLICRASLGSLDRGFPKGTVGRRGKIGRVCGQSKKFAEFFS
ncbi:MAG: hypothetical protein RLZZ458_1108 [Planctomycetota bacterium]